MLSKRSRDSTWIRPAPHRHDTIVFGPPRCGRVRGLLADLETSTTTGAMTTGPFSNSTRDRGLEDVLSSERRCRTWCVGAKASQDVVPLGMS
jgi:hypothetical protein